MAGGTERETTSCCSRWPSVRAAARRPRTSPSAIELPRRTISRRLREAQRAGLVASAITLTDGPGRDRVYWLTDRAPVDDVRLREGVSRTRRWERRPRTPVRDPSPGAN